MKTALVTTTINVPHVLKLYRACSNDVAFFVTGDNKTPHDAVVNFLTHMPRTTGLEFYWSPKSQRERGYLCSELLGFDTIGRRSIAILEALKWGADIIVTVDDDNIPIDLAYFNDFERVLTAPFSGCQVEPAVWFNVGSLCEPFFVQRGFPQGQLPNCYSIDSIVGAKVGVASGMAFGDPDISAIERMVKAPHVHTATELLRAGVVFQPRYKQWTVFNSQVTAFTRELAPCFLMVPQFKRYDDIFASLIAQRVMRELKQVVHFGRPFVHQSRNEHDLLKDLEAEIWGMRHVRTFADRLDALPLYLTAMPVVDQVSLIYDSINDLDFMPAAVRDLGMAWVADCRKVMG